MEDQDLESRLRQVGLRYVGPCFSFVPSWPAVFLAVSLHQLPYKAVLKGLNSLNYRHVWMSVKLLLVMFSSISGSVRGPCDAIWLWACVGFRDEVLLPQVIKESWLIIDNLFAATLQHPNNQPNLAAIIPEGNWTPHWKTVKHCRSTCVSCQQPDASHCDILAREVVKHYKTVSFVTWRKFTVCNIVKQWILPVTL